MKKGIHPEYREVVFKDVSADFEIITRSTIKTTDKITLNGKEYPLYKVDISSASHPFYTGTQKVIDTEGRVDRFKKKYGLKK
ncbi:MAG: type B 50S ribosomal protein L31 [Bacteriovoracaceae bacterium]